MKNDRSDAAGHDNKCPLWSISKLTQLKKWTCIGNIKLNDSIASPALTVSVHLIIHYDLVPSDWSSSIFFRPVIKLFFCFYFFIIAGLCVSLSLLRLARAEVVKHATKEGRWVPNGISPFDKKCAESQRSQQVGSQSGKSSRPFV